MSKKNSSNNSNYYTARKKKLIKGVKKFLKNIYPQLFEDYGQEIADKIYKETILEYEKLVPQFSYIGGKSNNLSSQLVQGAWGIALYKALKKHGGTAEYAGALTVESINKMLDKIPAFIRKLMGCQMLKNRHILKANRQAELSQLRKYPENWVWTITKGKGIDCDVAVDYTECGLQKFAYKQDAKEFLPYLCQLDYIVFEKFGLNLNRTKTLAQGNECCNFRISKK